ncbi:hypothetical protein ASPWEDRAFT_22452 [Aspergillus wentii DTO 134E9]|uniref:Uncharacterized protein n=1 Tax=Aspergillus wentii DTO 134E9 TaxID=1073089 RepID=A0A1L9RZB9_ASPWE|nr:uncharacterized protein ASPWEDRAFT_22452 [Aspergillus wentii DTO 134E9]OJJ40255.1 hypothetical protein ASPWEDRAFT_22452 [Aspergillus wentii DTO 134E9]
MDSKTHSCTETPINIWPNAYHLEHSPLDYPEPLQLHGDKIMTPTSQQPLSLAADAASGRPFHAGSLSLHDYRKCLSQDDESIFYHGGKTLKRKNGAVNLQQDQTSSCLYPVSVSSSISNPPPLSPSYSLSVMSQRSEQELEGLDGFLLSSSGPTDIRTPIATLNTFRDRLGTPPFEPSFPSHNKTRSDSVLFDLKQSKTTMCHQGALFEILNPRESLKLARIVSYIEDVDCASFDSTDNHRNSRFSATTATTVLFDDPDSPIIQLDGLADIPAQDVYLDELDETNPLESTKTNEVQQKAHLDLVGDLPYNPIPSISERLQPTTTTQNPNPHTTSPIYANFHPTPPLRFEHEDDDENIDDNNDDEIGEPGHPIHEENDITRQR